MSHDSTFVTVTETNAHRRYAVGRDCRSTRIIIDYKDREDTEWRVEQEVCEGTTLVGSLMLRYGAWHLTDFRLCALAPPPTDALPVAVPASAEEDLS